jgi:hypothetical protein
LLDFDEVKLKKLVSCRLGESITSANVRVARIQDRTRRAVLETAGAVGQCCRIDVHIKKDAYLSGVTPGSESDASQEEELDDAEGSIRKHVLKMFKDQVAAESIHVVWVAQITSYVVLLEVTFVAARLLAHLAETDDHAMSELDISAVLYDGKWFGAEQATMERKLAALPPERMFSLKAAANIARVSSEMPRYIPARSQPFRTSNAHSPVNYVSFASSSPIEQADTRHPPASQRVAVRDQPQSRPYRDSAARRRAVA